MLSLARSEQLCVTEEMVHRLHYLFYSGIEPDHAGNYRDCQVFITGTAYIPPAPEEVPKQMAALVEDLNRQAAVIHPVELAAYAHRRLGGMIILWRSGRPKGRKTPPMRRLSG